MVFVLISAPGTSTGLVHQDWSPLGQVSSGKVYSVSHGALGVLPTLCRRETLGNLRNCRVDSALEADVTNLPFSPQHVKISQPFEVKGASAARVCADCCPAHSAGFSAAAPQAAVDAGRCLRGRTGHGGADAAFPVLLLNSYSLR